MTHADCSKTTLLRDRAGVARASAERTRPHDRRNEPLRRWSVAELVARAAVRPPEATQ